MKRGWIALILMAISILNGAAEYLYVTTNTEAYIVMLDEADAFIAENRISEAQTTAEKLDYRFSKQSPVFNIFMYHCDVSGIGSDLAMLTRYARTGEVGEFLATSAKARREIMNVHNAKLLNWENLL